MRILSLDTSSRFLSIALSEDRDVIREETHLLERRHSSQVIPRIKDLLDKSSFSIRDIDMFVVGIGPGSFTGLRIGVSTVKGFGVATKKPCAGVPSIDAMAMNALTLDNRVGCPDGQPTRLSRSIVPIIDAKRGNVYSAIYKKEKSRIVKKSKHLLLDIDELMKKVKGPSVFLGDGVPFYKERILRYDEDAVFLGEESWYPKAGSLAEIALRDIKRYKKDDLSKLRPIYMYPKDCQVRR